jgi:hypothetical protein
MVPWVRSRHVPVVDSSCFSWYDFVLLAYLGCTDSHSLSSNCYGCRFLWKIPSFPEYLLNTQTRPPPKHTHTHPHTQSDRCPRTSGRCDSACTSSIYCLPVLLAKHDVHALYCLLCFQQGTPSRHCTACLYFKHGMTSVALPRRLSPRCCASWWHCTQ